MEESQASRDSITAKNDLLEIKWGIHSSKLLIDYFEGLRGRVGSPEVKTQKDMWKMIAARISEKLNVSVTSWQCENRWRVLERSYNKYINNKNRMWNSRKLFECSEETGPALGKQRNLFPESLLPSDTTDISGNRPQTSETSEVNTVKGKSVKKHRKLSTLEKIRLDRLQYYKKKVEIEERRLKLQEERNELLKKQMESASRCWACRQAGASGTAVERADPQ